MNYVKYGLLVICGLIIGSVVHSVFADDIELPIAENNHEEAVGLLTASDNRMNKLIENMEADIQEIRNDYAPYIQDEEKVNSHAKELVCKTESTLATVKLQAGIDEEIELTPEDYKRLSEKKLWKCTEEVEESTEIDELLIEACSKHASNQETCPKIMKGVFQADSAQCTQGVGATNLNCGNIRPGSGKYGDPDIQWTVNNNFRKYESLSDGVFDNVALYAQLYEGQSIDYMRRVWARGGQGWADTVNQYANS